MRSRYEIRVDFNNQFNDRMIAGWRSGLQAGQLVTMVDDDGNTCKGTIKMVLINNLIQIQVHWDTWVDGEPLEIPL